MKAAILGAGGWGTALAVHLARGGWQVSLWARRQALALELQQTRENSVYLPGVRLPENVFPSWRLEEVLSPKDLVILAIPSQALRSSLARVEPSFWRGEPLLLQAAKGLELGTFARLSQVVAASVPQRLQERIAVLSGPNHAEEIARGFPAASVVASGNEKAARQAQAFLMGKTLRIYINRDLVGVELGGALKNIIALAAGICDGLGLGDNTKATVITRGLAEIVRLAIKLGAEASTFAGLSGMGDLIATAGSKHSRNWRAGYEIGQGEDPQNVLQGPQVVEGAPTARSALELAQKLAVPMPITEGVCQILKGREPLEVVAKLMEREPKAEMDHSGLWSRGEV
jgi:glycerol-3-phosphate dehydrogenase (NAD(P)+)